MIKDSKLVLVLRQCGKEGCDRVFKVLAQSKQSYCCKFHDPAYEERETCWTPGAYRDKQDFLSDPDKI